MKACILAAGRGKRLNPLTETRPKPILNVGGSPLLLHTIQMLRHSGIRDILLVVGYRKDQIKKRFGDGSNFKVNLEYVEQKEFLGTGHAANLAKNFAGEDSFMLIYGDLMMDEEVFKRLVDNFSNNEYDGLITARKVEDPSKYGILKTNDKGNLEKLVEKPPDDRYGNFANAGVYVFKPSIFESIEETQKSPRGEYELTDSIEISLKKGKIFHVLDIGDLYWSDVGHPWQMLDANMHFLREMADKTAKSVSDQENIIINRGGTIEEGVTVKGFLKLGDNSVIKAGTYIEGPVVVGDGCDIGPNAYLRPYAYVGSNCKVGNSSEVKNSIVMDNTAVPHLSYVGDSIIGSNVNLGCGTVLANVRLDKKPVCMNIKSDRVSTHRKKMGAVIGDNVSFGINVCIMPGKKIGSNAQIGSNTIVSEDVKKNALVYVEQNIKVKRLGD